MKIFLTGATGYIGRVVGRALTKGGHEVLGLTHSPEKAADMKALGVEAVVGDIKKPETFRKQADACDVLVHAAFEYSPEAVAADRSALDALISSARSAKSPRLLVYTSGVWVLGSHAGAPLVETAPTRPIAAVAWRPAHEQLALSAAGGRVSSVVLRPGCVYGGRKGLYANMIESAVEKKSVQVVGDGANCWPNVYVEDLAELYRLICEKKPEKEIYHGTDGSVESVGGAAGAFLNAVGGGKVEHWPVEAAKEKMGPFAEALAIDQRVSSDKAKKQLGWKPALNSVVNNAATLVAQWRGQ